MNFSKANEIYVSTYICIFLMEEMIVWIWHNKFFHAKWSITIIIHGQVQVTQLCPSFVISHESAIACKTLRHQVENLLFQQVQMYKLDVCWPKIYTSCYSIQRMWHLGLLDILYFNVYKLVWCCPQT